MPSAPERNHCRLWWCRYLRVTLQPGWEGTWRWWMDTCVYVYIYIYMCIYIYIYANWFSYRSYNSLLGVWVFVTVSKLSAPIITHFINIIWAHYSSLISDYFLDHCQFFILLIRTFRGYWINVFYLLPTMWKSYCYCNLRQAVFVAH